MLFNSKDFDLDMIELVGTEPVCLTISSPLPSLSVDCRHHIRKGGTVGEKDAAGVPERPLWGAGDFQAEEERVIQTSFEFVVSRPPLALTAAQEL